MLIPSDLKRQGELELIVLDAKEGPRQKGSAKG